MSIGYFIPLDKYFTSDHLLTVSFAIFPMKD